MSEPLRQGAIVPPRRFGPWTPAEVAAYAEASGDDNPLHFDPAIASAAGLASPPIHGMLLMGCFEPYLAAWQPDARLLRLSVKFIRPVLVGEAVDVSAKVVRAADPAVLRLTAKRGADLVCLAEASLRIEPKPVNG